MHPVLSLDDKMQMKPKTIATIFLIAIITVGASYFIFLKTQYIEDYIYRLTFPLSKLKNEQIVLVVIDNSTIREIGGYPFKRSEYAKAIAHILKGKPKVIGVDMFFDGIKDLDDDLQLAEVMDKADTNIVLGIYPMEFDSLFINVLNKNKSAPPIDNSYHFNNVSYGNVGIFEIEGGGIIRFIPTRFIDTRNGREYRPLPIVVVSKYIDNSGYTQKSLPNGPLIQTLGNIEIPLFKRINDIAPSRVMINYLGGRESFESILFEKIPETDTLLFKDKIVLLGLSADFCRDHFPTPISNRTPGVLIHANIIDTIINNKFILGVRLNYQLIYIAIIAIIASLSAIYMRLIPALFLCIIILIINVIVFRLLLLNYHLYLYIILPSISVLLSFVITITIKKIISAHRR